ncbi:MAG: cytochrome b/b6 domain-containing protein [Burkholderiales bacterium]
MKNKILVWDLPTRIGHWLLVASFALAWVTSESELFRLVHVSAGYVMGAVLAYRLIWGIVGTRYARFSSFLFTPGQARDYLLSLLRGKATHWIGHNPAGSYAIYAMLLLGFATVGSGWATYNEIGGDWMEELHEALPSIMLAVIVVHVAGVVAGSLAHRENLVRAMINGYKNGRSEEAIASRRTFWAALLIVLAAGAAVTAFLPA